MGEVRPEPEEEQAAEVAVADSDGPSSRTRLTESAKRKRVLVSSGASPGLHRLSTGRSTGGGASSAMGARAYNLFRLPRETAEEAAAKAAAAETQEDMDV